jgi:transketolase
VPPDLPIVAVEAGSTRGWKGFVGRSGAVVGIDRFGESGPDKALLKYFGFTVDKVVEAVKGVIART